MLYHIKKSKGVRIHSSTKNRLFFSPHSASLLPPERPMSQSKELVRTDRRHQVMSPADVGSYIPPYGVRKIEASTESMFRAQDSEFAQIEDPNIQSWYSLLDHSHRVSLVVADIAERRGCSPQEVEEARAAGFLHDVGKLDPSCIAYRQNRILNPYEKLAIDTHADISGAMILQNLHKVRPEDKEFLIKIYPLVLYHHRPWMLVDKNLRQMGYDLMISDIFVSLMETRHRPGLSQFEAIAALEEIIYLNKKTFRADLYPGELVRSKRLIEEKYGFNLQALASNG
ncbi:hypothetical protein BH11PAT3_BH11PAT3_3160 [soil metagenome]